MKLWTLLKKVSEYTGYALIGMTLTFVIIPKYPVVSVIALTAIAGLWYSFLSFGWAISCRLHLVEKYQKALEQEYYVSSQPEHDDHSMGWYTGYTRAIAEKYNKAVWEYSYDDPSDVFGMAALLYENDVYTFIIARRKECKVAKTYYRNLYYAYKDLRFVGYREYRKIVSGKLDLLKEYLK